MRHVASARFWACYGALPEAVQTQADREFELLKANPRHPSLHSRRSEIFWSARVGQHYRALAVEIPDGLLWFWIGTHAEYDKLLG